MNFLEQFNYLDYIVFGAVLIVTFLSVLYGNSKKKKAKSQEENLLEILLMGRSLTLPLFIATLVATWYGGIFGVASIAYESGIYNLVTQGFFWYLSYILFAFFIIKKINKMKALTLADLVGNMFGPKSKKLTSLFNILNLVPIAYTISMALIIKMLLGTDLLGSSIIGMILVLSYSLFGGFRAVVYSDLIQFFVMIVAVAIVFVLSVYKFGISPLQALPEQYFSLTGGHGLLETLSWGIIAISTLVDPNFYQRAFAAKSFSIAKKGILISTVIWFGFDVCMTFGAMYARAIMPEAGAQYGYFNYAFSLLPHGLKGFFLAGILATVLSTLDSYLFLCGSTITVDLLPGKLKNSRFKFYAGVISIALLSIVFASLFEGNIKKVWKALGSISSSSLLIPVLYGYFFKKKISDNQFILTAICSGLMTIFWRISGYKYVYQLDELYVGCATSLILLSFFHIKGKIKLVHS